MREDSRGPNPAETNRNIPTPDGGSDSFEQLSAKSVDLKTQIEEARRRYDLPPDAAPGDPNREERAADGGQARPEKEND
jgi:hypothetical protein